MHFLCSFRTKLRRYNLTPSSASADNKRRDDEFLSALPATNVFGMKMRNGSTDLPRGKARIALDSSRKGRYKSKKRSGESEKSAAESESAN